MQVEFGESAASIRVRLLIKCRFYTRLYGTPPRVLSGWVWTGCEPGVKDVYATLCGWVVN